MAKALTQAFRISAEALDVGLHEWDFSAVQKNSTDTWIQFDRHFTGSNMSLSCHSDSWICWTLDWMFWKSEGGNKVPYCRNEKEFASFSQLQTARWFWKPIDPPWLWWNCWYFSRWWCFCHERVPKWLWMVLDYDLSHRNRLSTLFLSSILTRGWVALTFF